MIKIRLFYFWKQLLFVTVIVRIDLFEDG